MVQIKQKGLHGFENPPPRTFFGRYTAQLVASWIVRLLGKSGVDICLETAAADELYVISQKSAL